jgi:hypothetical protein
MNPARSRVNPWFAVYVIVTAASGPLFGLAQVSPASDIATDTGRDARRP